MEVVRNYFSQLNWVDIFFVICLIRTCYIGFSRGFTPEIPRLICAFLTVVLSYQLCGKVGQFLSRYPVIRPESIDALAFIVLVAFFAILSKVICMLYRVVMKASGPHMFEVAGGCILGFIRGVIIASLLLICTQYIAPEYVERSVDEGSIVGNKLIIVAPKINEFIETLLNKD
jgi:uncharacterized membrane protein required for colicin V production